MKSSKQPRSRLPYLAVSFGLGLASISCSPVPAPAPVREPKTKLVIISHLGEVTRDARYVGEEIRYRIYFAAIPAAPATLTIEDRLEPGLKFLRAHNGGTYDPTARTVTWRVEESSRPRGAFVEFDASLGAEGSIPNRATLRWRGGELKTNSTETVVCRQPPAGWLPLVSRAAEGQRPDSYVKDETTTGLLVNFDLPGLYVTEEKAEGRLWHRLMVPGHSHTDLIGAPELPLLGQIVEVPHHVSFTVEVEKSETVPVGCYNVWPAQERPIWQAGAADPPFTLDAAAYTRDAPYPGTQGAIEAEDIGIVRGHRLVLLKAYPLQYNPVTREMEAYSKLELRIRYDRTAQVEAIDSRLLSPAFEALVDAAAPNHIDADRFEWGTAGSEEKSGADYLILAESGFINASDPNNPLELLRVWKQRKGWLTRIVDLANLPSGGTAADIEAYLQAAYASWDPAPVFVLLVGDADLVPPAYHTAHTNHNGTLIGTDLYYAAVDGTDYWPDIFIGRLPVSTMQELRDLVRRLIDYEQNPPAAANFYTDAPLVMLFEDDTDSPTDSSPSDGREDWGFGIIERAEALRTHLQGGGYTIARIYDQSGTHAAGPTLYEDGSALPDFLTLAGNPAAGIPGFPWNGGTADIRAAINGGSFLVTYAGHGWRQGWSRPGFGVADATGLTNGAMAPVVLSWTCQSGWFDNETDAADIDPAPGVQGTGVNDESLMETFVMQPADGAIAAIGSARNSNDINLELMDGAARALWPDYPVAATGGRLPRLGQLLNYAKLYMAGQIAAGAGRQRHFEMYHLLGDPEMPVWTEAPGDLDVAHPDGIGSTGMQEFAVTVLDDATKNPVRNATVTLTRSGAIVDMHQTDPAGIVRFQLVSPVAQQLDLTVTAYDYRPYMGTITVSSGGAELNRLDPANGPEGQVIRVGGVGFSGSEQVEIRLDGTLAATTTTSGAGSFGQAGGTDVTATLPSPHSPGPVNVIATSASGRHAARIFQVRTANATDPYTYDQHNSATWTLHPGDNPTWNNPEIQLYDSGGNPVESDNLTAGDDYTIEVKVHNDTDFDANAATVTFKWANYGIGQPFEEIGPDPAVVVDLPKNDVTEVTHRWTPQATGHLCIKAEIYHIEDIDPDNNVGQENCHVGAATSPYKIPFQVCNPTDEATAMFLELRQLEPVPDPERRPWGTWVRHPDPQVLKPGECREAVAIVDPDPARAKKGDKAEFALTGFADGKIVGGVNFVVIKR